MVFFSSKNFALHVDRDFLRQVAVGHGRRHFGDVAHLDGQVAGHEVHVVGQVLPRAGDASHLGLPAQFPFRADLARDARHLRRERTQLVHHRVDGVLQLENFALDVDGDFLRQVAVRHGRRRPAAMLRTWPVRLTGHEVHVVRQVLPCAGDASHLGLRRRVFLRYRLRAPRASLPTRTNSSWSTIVLMVFFSSRISPLTSTVIFFDRSPFATAVVTSRDVPHLIGQVASHEVDVVGEILPRARHALHLCLPAQFPFRAHFARDARHFRGKRVQLVHHRVDGVFQLKDLAAAHRP